MSRELRNQSITTQEDAVSLGELGTRGQVTYRTLKAGKCSEISMANGQVPAGGLTGGRRNREILTERVAGECITAIGGATVRKHDTPHVIVS